MSNPELTRFAMIDFNSVQIQTVRFRDPSMDIIAFDNLCVARGHGTPHKFIQLGSLPKILSYLESEEVRRMPEKPSIGQAFAKKFEVTAESERRQPWDDHHPSELDKVRSGFADGSPIVLGPSMSSNSIGKRRIIRQTDSFVYPGVWMPVADEDPTWKIVAI